MPSFCTAATCAVILKRLPNNLCSGLLCIDRHWHFPSASAAVLIIMIAVKITKNVEVTNILDGSNAGPMSICQLCPLVILEFLSSSAIPNKKFTSHVCVETMGWPWLCPGDQYNRKDVFGSPPFVWPASLRNLQWIPVNWRGIHIFPLVTGDCQAVADWSLGPCQWGLIPELCFSRKSML